MFGKLNMIEKRLTYDQAIFDLQNEEERKTAAIRTELQD